MLPGRMTGAYCFCPVKGGGGNFFFYLFFFWGGGRFVYCLLSTLIFVITFEPLELEFS